MGIDTDQIPINERFTAAIEVLTAAVELLAEKVAVLEGLPPVHPQKVVEHYAGDLLLTYDLREPPVEG